MTGEGNGFVHERSLDDIVIPGVPAEEPALIVMPQGYLPLHVMALMELGWPGLEVVVCDGCGQDCVERREAKPPVDHYFRVCWDCIEDQRPGWAKQKLAEFMRELWEGLE